MATDIQPTSMYRSILRAITRAQGRIGYLQRGLADGKAIHAPSDDPVGTALTLRARDRAAAVEQYQRNLSSGRSHLEATDSLLTQLEDVIVEMRTLAVKAANGSIGEEERRIMGEEADALLRQAIDLGNEQFAGIYLLGGTRSRTAPLTPERDRDGEILAVHAGARGGAPVLRQVGDELFMNIRLPASDVIGEQQELFGRLIDVRDALRASDQEALTALAGSLVEDQDRVLAAHGVVGSWLQRAEVLETRLESDATAFAEDRTRIEELDVPAALMELEQQQVALRAALETGARILDLSLLDYLR